MRLGVQFMWLEKDLPKACLGYCGKPKFYTDTGVTAVYVWG